MPIANSEWSFGVCEPGKPAAPDDKHICYPAGFQPGRLYELIYRAKDPTVGGLGFAATRDLGAFLRNSPQDDCGAPIRSIAPTMSRSSRARRRADA